MDTPGSNQELADAARFIVQGSSVGSPDGRWDQVMSVLLTAREQHGGEVRRLVTALLSSGRYDEFERVVADLSLRLQATTRPMGRAASKSAEPESANAVQLSLFERGNDIHDRNRQLGGAVAANELNAPNIAISHVRNRPSRGPHAQTSRTKR